jgi:hypothetical protein
MPERSNALTRPAAVLLAVAALLLAGATAAHASTPAPTQRTGVAAGHVDAVIPPRIFPIRLVPVAFRPRVQRVVSRMTTTWGSVKVYIREHPDEIAEGFEKLRDGIEEALDAWDRLDPDTCTPVIEPICAGRPLPHNAASPAQGIILAPPFVGAYVSLTCRHDFRAGPAYYTPTLRRWVLASYVWTYWYPALVPNMARC